jgi:lauroyl/myristoyl acyltransferase
VRALPPGFNHAVAAPGGAAWYWLNGRQRRSALENYAAALGRDRSDPEVARVARRAFQNYGRMLLDFMLIGNLTPDELLNRMSMDGRDNLDAALSAGRGVIMAVPHMGSWDMAGAYGGALGYPISAVTERFPGSLNDAVVRTRSRFGLNVIMLGRAAIRSITPAYQYTVSPGRHHVHLDPAISWPAGTTKESLMQTVISRFEEFIKARPDQWYAFRPIYKNEG